MSQKIENKDFHIDPDNLDVELIRQPELMLIYAVKVEEYRAIHDSRKNALELIKADIDLNIRLSPESYLPKGVKVTETAISHALVKDADYQQALESLQEARSDLEVMKAAVTALEHRKEALTNLVRLHGQKYFATPETSMSLGEKMSARERRDENVTDRIRQKSKRRRHVEKS
jgi:predicted nucleotide-binding protein (sugar kinase/HSP70/actin superfamily)